MNINKKTILVFGVGELQISIIKRAQNMGLFVVGIDPCEDAFGKDVVDTFEVVGGQDFEKTIEVARKYNISAVITASTDKPLVMMARVAEALHLKFYSVKTAQISTDKFLMKQCFERDGIPCAKGRLVHSTEEAKDLTYPIIVKPRDNSGSRGVVLCNNSQELETAIKDALSFSKKDSVLVEEYIEGQEYSIESLHFDNKSVVIQFTEKTTTPFPYNVELEHKQPAQLTEEQKNNIRNIISQIGKSLQFENCASHTELKINNRGIFIIETSPRLGGDFITSTLTPLSSGVNIEDQLLNIALDNEVDLRPTTKPAASGVLFFQLPEGIINHIDPKIEDISTWPNVVSFRLKLKEGDKINKITSSLNRYGEIIVKDNSYNKIKKLLNSYAHRAYQMIK